MRSEEACNANERFLATGIQLSPEATRHLQQSGRTFVKERNLKTDALHHQFMDWSPTQREIALDTIYAYADFKIPKSFDCVFELDQPENVVFTPIELTQALFNSWYAMDNIAHGHKHTCVFRFEDGIPEVMNELYLSDGKEVPPLRLKMLGFCTRKDLPAIQKRQTYIKKLEKKHGHNWWKYYDEYITSLE